MHPSIQSASPSKQAATRPFAGLVADCLECAGGFYADPTRPACFLCGHPMPADMLRVVRGRVPMVFRVA